MTTRVKSTLLLIATLLIGMVLGALLNARLADQRIERIAFLRSQRGFVRAIEQSIEPQNEEQRESVRAILDQAAVRIGEQFRDSRTEMQAIIDSTKAALSTVLTEEQMEQVNERLELRRPPMWRGRRGPPNRPPGR